MNLFVVSIHMNKSARILLFIMLALVGILVVMLVITGIANLFSGEENDFKINNSFDDAIAVISDADSMQSISASEVDVDFVNKNDYYDLGITDEINELIKEYFTRYFSSLGSFEDLTMDELFYMGCDYENAVANAMISYQNMIRRDMDADLGYSAVTVGINYESLKRTEVGYTIYLTQNDYMNYNFISDITSYTCDVEHTFDIAEDNGKYFITAHSEISGVYDLIVGNFEEYLENTGKKVEKMGSSEIYSVLEVLNEMMASEVDAGFEALMTERDAYNTSPDSFLTTLTAEYEYDADAALEYSYLWAGKYEAVRNPEFAEYDDYGGNCNNFTSQCLYYSGIPMDLTDYQWKWFGETLNNSYGAYGRSSSWTGVEYFYTYCVENDKSGIVADTGSNIFSGRPGDILQYVSNGIGVHSAIITKVIHDDEGNVVDYLINSNTTDKVDCPMSAYGYYDFRLIKIIGYNS